MSNNIHLYDNNLQGYKVRGEEVVSDILKISNIGSLRECKDLLLYPHSFDLYGDKIQELSILSSRNLEFDKVNEKYSVDVVTGNLMGFVGINNTSISIHSRFSENIDDKKEPNEGKDFFLYYMLQKVFAINIFSLDHSFNQNSNILNFLILLFPFMLKKALSQGIYKEYRRFENNDSRIKGVLNIPGIIKNNIPFRGNLCYTNRLYSADNNVLQLIRHTIEYIKTQQFGQFILNGDPITKDYVRLIENCTPSYSYLNRCAVLNNNLKNKIHPYYLNYVPLQKLCRRILRHEKLKYGEENDKVYGILFDGAWLWEEYLNSLLGKLNIVHPQNKTKTNGIYLFSHPLKAPRYPDFYGSGIVMDAKYKRYENLDVADIGREDLSQIISYMYVLASKHGAILIPSIKEETAMSRKLSGEYGGEVHLISLIIPSDIQSYGQFIKEISKSENSFTDVIKTLQNSLNHV